MTKFNLNAQTLSKPGLHRVTPQQQLWSYLTDEQKHIVGIVLRRLKLPDQEDICYGLIAFKKYGIEREFASPFMQAIHENLIDLLKGNNN